METGMDSAAVVELAFGMRHAVDADHVAAVASLAKG
jgi:high-affinity nickel permease